MILTSHNESVTFICSHMQFYASPYGASISGHGRALRDSIILARGVYVMHNIWSPKVGEVIWFYFSIAPIP